MSRFPRLTRPMENRTPHLETLLELDNRHEELLQRLDELDTEVARVLKQWRSASQPEDTPG